MGYLQLTPVAEKHANLMCTTYGKKLSRYVEGYNIQLGSCYLQYAYQMAGHDWLRALVVYNAGITRLTALDKYGRVPTETAHYIVRVMSLATKCINSNSVTAQTLYLQP